MLAPTLLPRTRRRSRRKTHQPRPGMPIFITSATVAGVQLTLVLDQPVTLNGTPAYTCGDTTAGSATKTGENEVTILFDDAPPAGTPIVIPFQDPAIRNGSGGFVTPNQVLATNV